MSAQSSQAAPTPLPKYIYKILPSSPPPPSPLPFNLPLSALDARDGFMHLSTSFQILRTLKAYFASAARVYILRIEYETVAKYVKWEDTKRKGPDEKGACWDVKGEAGYFPHVYGNGVATGEEAGLKMGREEVESVRAWEKGAEGWSAEDWPFGEDVPE